MAGKWRWLRLALVLALVSGCASLAVSRLDQLFGPPGPPPVRTVAEGSDGARLYSEQVRPLLANRCVVCHGCYDAPCQLKLTSAAGIDRGLSKDKVYNGERLLASPTTRLHIDAQNAGQWRALGFAPVLNERQQTAEANLQGSLLMRALDLKKAQPLPEGPILPESFDFALDRKQQCPTIDEYDEFAQKQPLWGMPYGLPGLKGDELALLERWVAAGSPMAEESSLSAAEAQLVAQWEQRLNGDDLKSRLVARYLYEHLFLNHLYFDQLPTAADQRPRFFNLVRSVTPPGEPVYPVASRRPYDDPGVERVYYRLVAEPELILAKTHNPYLLNEARWQRWQQLFFTPDYQVTSWPGYDDKVAANPFKAFAQLPVNSRHRFLLDDARSIVMGFIKGPVCRGQMAVNVINDHFWVFFVSPDLELGVDGNRLQSVLADDLRLPSEAASNALPLSNWVRYSRTQTRYLTNKVLLLNELVFKNQPLDLNLVWDGDGHDDDAGLTIFRHFDSASVVPGLVGGPPKTAWLIDYPMFERIHYLLVAGFDVYGNLGHQLVTRQYMDFLRMEGEFNFLALLPPAERLRLRDYWYRGASDAVKAYLYGPQTQLHHAPAISYHSDQPQQELYQLLQQRLAPVLDQRLEPAASGMPAEWIAALAGVQAVPGLAASRMPEVTQLLLTDKGKLVQVVSLLRTSAHSNITSLFDEAANRLPAEDQLVALAGVVGDYPNAFWQLEVSELATAISQIAALTDESSYQALLGRYGVRRTDPRFWGWSDALAAWSLNQTPLTAGILDYNRFENR